MNLKKYAALLVNYCISVRKGDKVLVKSSTLAEPLLKYIHDEILLAGGHPHFQISISGTESSFYQYADNHQLEYIDELTMHALSNFDCYLVVRAPENLRATNRIDAKKSAIRSKAMKPLNEVYFSRTATLELRRSLCQFPTHASAQEAGMSLDDYQKFVFEACGLHHENPIDYWLSVRKQQQKLVDYLNTKKHIRYVTKDTDIEFSTEGRTWINSDGRTNMPSGEVFTAPVEDSVNGVITFSYPSIYKGKEIKNVKLTVQNGYIEHWDAETGKEFLDDIFKIEGTRRFGEAAIGTNYQIQEITKNILFDEKIGGSVHMAIGQSYAQCGGKNQSPIHWDMITDMKQNGQIYADGELFYENGKVILDL